MNRSERRSQMDRAAGLTPPEECQEREFLLTLREAALCGLKTGSRRKMLEDIRDMIRLRLDIIESKV